MADLVETVARIIDNGVDEPSSWAAKDIIAAVLDDMAEPSEGMIEAGALVRARGYATDDIWQAMLAQYRKEMLP